MSVLNGSANKSEHFIRLTITFFAVKSYFQVPGENNTQIFSDDTFSIGFPYMEYDKSASVTDLP